MKTIVAGSRSINDYNALVESIEACGWKPTTIVSGCASGVDRLGEIWAHKNNMPIERYPAQWDKHGKQAGFLRNIQMAEHADALIAIWDGKSPGTKHMIDTAHKNNLKTFIKII